jgi:hypothetical protein
VVFATGNGFIVAGGLTAADTTTAAIIAVDVRRHVASPAGFLKVPVHDAAGSVVAGRDLVFGGGSASVDSVVQDVTPGSEPRVVSRLPQPRADLVAVSDGVTSYIVGGYDGVHGSATVLATRNSRTYTTVGLLPIPVRYPAIAITAEALWVFGGESDGRAISDVQRIDVRTGRAVRVGQLPHPLAHAAAFALAGSVFLAGGRVRSATTNEVLRFDPESMSFTAAGHLPAARSDFAAVVVDGVGYLVGGEDTSPVNTVIEVNVQSVGG